jgi:GT2 family glycosyltransferase
MKSQQHSKRTWAEPASPDVSVIIVSWNTRELLRDCLRSLHNETGDISSEVVVVDNASTDGSSDMVTAEFPVVRLVQNTENRGFASANNQGMAIARGRYVLLLNSDTRVLDGAVRKTVAFADAHPEAAVVGCRTLNLDGSVQWNCYMFPSLTNLALSLTRLSTLFTRNRFFGRSRMTWWNYDTPRVVDAVAGCFMLVRREAIDQVGPMAEDYFMYSEDTDWCWRFHRHGWKVMYTPTPVIVHARAASSSQSATEMHLLQRRSVLMFLEKKSGRLTRGIANLMFLLGSVIRLPLLAINQMRGGQKAEDARRQWQLSTASLRFHLKGRLPVSS